MTLSGRREPSFHGAGLGAGLGAGHRDEHHASDAHAAHAVHSLKSGTHFTRFISGFQAISTLIGVPLALASGYTLYRTNFSPDTTCSNLRASIVSMLDKNVDPATRRALVKRDIEAFEAGCGAVDPDAHAAFKALLAADKGVAQAAPAAKVLPAPKPVAVASAKEAPKDAKPEAKPEAVKQEAAKVELRPAIAESKAEPKVEPSKVVAAAPAIGPAEAAQPTEQMSDTRWLDAVRQALVDQPTDAGQTATVGKSPENAARHDAVLPNKPGEPVLQPNWNVAAPAVQSPAAPLPPPVPVNNLQAVPSNPNRPVPPADVPTAQYVNNGANGGTNGSSWVAQIPFVGRMIDGAGN